MARKTELATGSRTELAEARAALVRKIKERLTDEGNLDTEIEGLHLYRRHSPTTCASAAYQPTLVLYAQGQKRVTVGSTTLVCDGGMMQITSVDIPVISQVVRASEDEPILAMVVGIDLATVREILARDEHLANEVSASARGIAVGKAPLEILQGFTRLLELLDTPRDIPFLGDLMRREILYRLLRGPLGKHLRATATLGEQSNRTAKAVAWLKSNFDKPLRVEELASLAQMGVSTFHHHFRVLTAMSPLQYQKRIRLHEARVRMLTGDLDAASAAFAVGYESASQFSREYSRLFGQPPMRDVKTRILAPGAALAQE